MKTKNLLLFICLLLIQNIWSQQLLPDSLIQKSVEEKIVFLNNEGQKQQSIDSLSIYFNEALKLTKTCDCDSLKVNILYDQARHYIITGKPDLGIEKLDALEHLLHRYLDTTLHYKKESIASYAYFLKNNDSLAIKHIENALQYAIAMNDSLRIADTYSNLGKNFISISPIKAKQYFYKALDIYNTMNVSASKKHTIYQNLSRTFNEKDSILFYSNKSYSYIKDTTDIVTMANFYIDKADALFSKKYFQTSKVPAEKAYKYAKKIKYNQVSYIALSILGNIALQNKNYKKAIQLLNEANSLKNISLYNKKSALEYLVSAYKKDNQLEQALQTSQELLAITDSLYEQRKTSTFAEFDAKFNLAEKDKAIAQHELELIKQKNARNQWIFGSVGISLLGIIGVLWFTYKQKRKKAKVQMELQKEQEINQLRTKFLGNIAHEIRTPLTLVSGNLNLALENLDHKTKAKNNLKIALDNTKKITDDANEILELLKFEGQKSTLNYSTVPLRTSLERIIFSFHSMAQIKAVEISYKSSIAKAVLVSTDIGKVEKIVNNLLSNAIKYAPSNSKVIVTDAFSNNNLTLSVTDFGEGISYDEQKKIFERFYQSESASKVGGIGIGLALSKEFAEFLNGHLTVESKPEKGSTFTLQLPMQTVDQLVEDDSQPNSISHKKQLNHKPSTQESILIVEDNPQMASYLKELLENTYSCDIAFNGEEALNLLKTNNYALITSDIMMPKVDGFELREQINSIDKHKNTPFIFISAKTLETDKIKGFSLGVSDYIVKPFNKNELLARIKNLLKNKASRIQWQLENTDQLSKTESSDQKLLRKIETYILDNIDNDDFKIKELADYVGYSQRQLARIMKQYTGMSPVKFILEIRLQKAFTHLQNKSFFTLSEVRYAVGINSSAYFNKKFKERFGIAPSDLI